MLPNSPDLLLRLIKSNTSFLVYGQKASGKTRLVHQLLGKAEAQFIEINCTLTSKKQNFLWLFNVQLRKYLKDQGIQIESLGQPVNLDTWITEIKKLVNQKRTLNQVLDNLYIYMDNIEEMAFQESFIPSFYNACQKEFSFRFNFIFCGTNFLRKEYTLDLPFRTMVAFCMPKPIVDFNKIVDHAVEESLKNNFGKICHESQIEKSTKFLSKQIKASFEDIQSNLQKMKTIATVLTDSIKDLVEGKQLYKSLAGIVNRGEFKRIVQQVVEHGPLQETLLKHKIHAVDGEQAHQAAQNMEYYPQLVLSSVHMADYYPEKEDKRRFQDYKGRSNYRNKDLKKSDFKVGKHNIQRIIAISEALQSQAKENDKEFAAQHHTLDYYTTFENLRNENRLKFYGNKLTGIVKEQQAKAFIAKCELKYDQFMSS